MNIIDNDDLFWNYLIIIHKILSYLKILNENGPRILEAPPCGFQKCDDGVGNCKTLDSDFPFKFLNGSCVLTTSTEHSECYYINKLKYSLSIKYLF